MAIKANMIIEVMGRPPEHVKRALEEIADKLGEEKEVELKNKKIHEPKLIDPKESGIYTSFTEIEAEFDTLIRLLDIVFIYMPASLEITHPPEVKMNLNDFNTIINTLALRLHRYDAVAKRLNFERDIFLKQLEQAGIQPGIQPPQIPSQAQKEKEEKKEKKKGERKKSKK